VKAGRSTLRKRAPAGGLHSFSLSLPILAKVLLATLLTAFLAALLFFSRLALLRLPWLLRLAADLRITFAARSLAVYFFRLPWYASLLVALKASNGLWCRMAGGNCLKLRQSER